MCRTLLLLSLLCCTLMSVACSGSSEKPDQDNMSQKATPLAPAVAEPAPVAKVEPTKMVVTGVNAGVEAGFPVAAIWVVPSPQGPQFYLWGKGVTTADAFTLEFEQSELPARLRFVKGTKQIGTGMVMAWHKDAKMITEADGKIDPKGLAFAFGQAVDHALIFAHDDAGELVVPMLAPGFKQDVITCGQSVASDARGGKDVLNPVSCDTLKLVPIDKTGMQKPRWM